MRKNNHFPILATEPIPDVPTQVTDVGSGSNEVAVVPEVQDFNCPSAGLYPAPNDCGAYFQCSPDGKAFPQRCAAGLHFNAESKICDWPDNAQCTINQRIAGPSKYVPPQTFIPTFYQPSHSLWQWFGHLPFYNMPSTHKSVKPHFYNAHAYKFGKGGGKNVVCYFANWAHLRKSSGKFVPENIDARPCSHIFYAFANLDTESFEAVPGQPAVDVNDGYFNR